jgi:hypothetical protein
MGILNDIANRLCALQLQNHAIISLLRDTCVWTPLLKGSLLHLFSLKTTILFISTPLSFDPGRKMKHDLTSEQVNWWHFISKYNNNRALLSVSDWGFWWILLWIGPMFIGTLFFWCKCCNAKKKPNTKKQLESPRSQITKPGLNV